MVYGYWDRSSVTELRTAERDQGTQKSVMMARGVPEVGKVVVDDILSERRDTAEG